MTNKPRAFEGLRFASKPGLNCPQKARGKKRGAVKIINVARGPMKLRPTQAHKSKKTYNRKKTKSELKSILKITA